ncbi:MAG: M28 family peptidase [Oscillospiraceae bacterium]|nr:M28 family peptidase [Oscillospiraceae bacterium]
MKKRVIALFLAIVLVFSLSGCGDKVDETVEEAYPLPQELQIMYDAFIEAVDTNYAYDIAVELAENPQFRSSALGSRTAGSDAEHEAALWLAEQMLEIGLIDVELVGVPCDKWQFNGATIQLEGDDKLIQLHSYATGATSSQGITAEIIYAGQGTMYDYEDLDATGKIVLIDINQRDDWWITYPLLQAEYEGAIAILASQDGGFAEISNDALNAQDVCGPVSIPCLSISRNDARYIMELLEDDIVEATLIVDNIVAIGEGTTYNVVGKIPGKSSDRQILLAAHYDMYFDGFQDDSAAVGLVLAISKAMIDSLYIPENDILVVLHGAEEWGSSYTQFDWLTGSWEMINNAKPDWQSKTLAILNFELPAFEFDAYTYSSSPHEFFTMLEFFTNTWELSPTPEHCFPEGVLTDGYMTYTYSDDFAYMIAGVPSLANGFLFDAEGEDVFDFYYEIYHSNFDTKDTYNEAVMDFNLKYYGAMAIYIDQTPALYLDFTAQYDRLTDAVDEEIMALFGADMDSYFAAVEEMNEAAKLLRNEVQIINLEFYKAWENGATDDELAVIREKGAALTDKNLKIFKFIQDRLLGLMYEWPIVPHEAPQFNIGLMLEAISSLEEGDIDGAFEAALTVNNYMEWYAMFFSPEVIAIETDMHWGRSNQENLYWGSGKNFTKADVNEASIGIFSKYDEEDPDFTREIEVYVEAVEAQGQIMLSLFNKEIEDIKLLTQLLKED